MNASIMIPQFDHRVEDLRAFLAREVSVLVDASMGPPACPVYETSVTHITDVISEVNIHMLHGHSESVELCLAHNTF